MKKSAFVIALLLLVSLAGCGKTENVNRDTGKSSLYSESEIQSAMDVVVAKFKHSFQGCELTDLWYDEEYSSARSADWAEQYGAEEAIALLSNFTVDGSGGDGSLNPNSTYKNWNWILVRGGSGDWTLKDWGY